MSFPHRSSIPPPAPGSPPAPDRWPPPPASDRWAPPGPAGGWARQPGPAWSDASPPPDAVGRPAVPGWPAPTAEARAAEPPPSAGVLVLATLWRLGIGSLALYYAQTGRDETMATESLSYQSNVAVGVGFLALAAYPLVVAGRRHEPRSAWLRGTLTITMLLVAAVFMAGMGGEPDGPHAVIPALVLVDWLFVGRSQFRTRWWEPPTWTVLLIAYLVYHRANDLGLYPDILGEDRIGTTVPLLLAGCIGLGYLLHGAATVRRAVGGGQVAGTPRPPGEWPAGRPRP